MKTMEISTHIGCRHACFFCPQKTLVKEYKKAPVHSTFFAMDDYRKCIDALPLDVRVDFSGYAEPFFHPEAPEMVKYAKEKGHEVHIYTTLMGITPEGFKTLKASNADFYKIHCPDTKGLIVPDDEFIAQHDLFLQENIPCSYMAMGPLTSGLESYFKQLNIDVELPHMLSRGGNNWDVKPKGGKRKLICTMNRWHSNVLLPNGNVYGCCMDYGLTVPLGNLLRQTYQEIYDAAEQWKDNDHSNDICSKCEWASG